MKRFIPLILLISLLCACAPETVSPSPAPTPEQTAPPADGGFTVRTDYSNYTPYKVPEAQYTRLSDDWIADLAPGDDYGMLYPFVGAKLYSSHSGGYSSESGALYGLFDESGRIVADATYVGVDRLGYYDYAAQETKQTSFLLLSRTEYLGTIDYGYGEYEDGRAVYAIASLDGSFVTECKYGFVRGFDGGILCAESHDSEEFIFYDNSGNTLFTHEDIPFDNYSLYSIGMGEGTVYLSTTVDGGECYYYLDTEGNILHGPYMWASSYAGGLAVVSPEGWSASGVIDKNGKWVIEPKYENITRCGGERFIAQKTTDSFCVLNATGEELFAIECDWLAKTGYGYRAVIYGDYSAKIEDKFLYLDESGEEIFTQLSSEWLNVCESPALFCREVKYGLELMNAETGKKLFIERGAYAQPLYTDYMIGEPATQLEMISVAIEPEYSYSEFYHNTYVCVSYDLEILFESGETFPSVIADEITSREYIYSYDTFELFDSTGQEKEFTLIGAYPGITSIWNNRIMYCDDTCFTCEDMDGTVLFRYCFTMSGGD